MNTVKTIWQTLKALGATMDEESFEAMDKWANRPFKRYEFGTYETGETDGQRWIRCRICNMRSYHPNDVEYKFCANCHLFHEG